MTPIASYHPAVVRRGTRGRRRSRLEQWFNEGAVRRHCIAWETATGLRWAKLLVDLRAAGRAMPIKDSLIAATALTHDLAIATLNRRDFEASGVELIDPARGSYRPGNPPQQTSAPGAR